MTDIGACESEDERLAVMRGLAGGVAARSGFSVPAGDAEGETTVVVGDEGCGGGAGAVGAERRCEASCEDGCTAMTKGPPAKSRFGEWTRWPSRPDGRGWLRPARSALYRRRCSSV